jgi:hypothetical protein
VKLGIVSDLHCNFNGLTRALDIMGQIDELLCLGDSIYEYPFSNEVVASLERRTEGLVIIGRQRHTVGGPEASPPWSSPLCGPRVAASSDILPQPQFGML